MLVCVKNVFVGGVKALKTLILGEYQVFSMPHSFSEQLLM